MRWITRQEPAGSFLAADGKPSSSPAYASCGPVSQSTDLEFRALNHLPARDIFVLFRPPEQGKNAGKKMPSARPQRQH